MDVSAGPESPQVSSGLDSTYLITDSAGFLGSHLYHRLIAEGACVICLDDFSTGRHENIAHLIDHDRFELVEHDVTRPINLDVDEIYNLACPASPPQYQANPIKTNKTSVAEDCVPRHCETSTRSAWGLRSKSMITASCRLNLRSTAVMHDAK